MANPTDPLAELHQLRGGGKGGEAPQTSLAVNPDKGAKPTDLPYRVTIEEKNLHRPPPVTEVPKWGGGKRQAKAYRPPYKDSPHGEQTP